MKLSHPLTGCSAKRVWKHGLIIDNKARTATTGAAYNVQGQVERGRSGRFHRSVIGLVLTRAYFVRLAVNSTSLPSVKSSGRRPNSIRSPSSLPM